MIITIDGKAGTGKSTVGKLLSDRLGILFFSTGMLIRFVSSEYKINLERGMLDSEAQFKAINNLSTETIRHLIISPDKSLRSLNLVPYMKTIVDDPKNLDQIDNLLETYCKGKEIILDGRDTFRIFPNAGFKFYFETTKNNRVSNLSKGERLPINQASEIVGLRDRSERFINIPYEELIVLDPFDYEIEDLISMMYELVSSNK